MKICFLVAAHADPLLLKRTCRQLTHSTPHDALVHVDASADVNDFRCLTDSADLPVHYAERRLNVRWGDFSLVEVSINLLKLAVAGDADYFVFMSGSDYPIKNIGQLELHLQRCSAAMNIWPFPDSIRGKPESRLTRPHYFPRDRRSVVGKIVNRGLRLAPVRRDYRAVLDGWQAYAGSSWWALSRPIAERVIMLDAKHAAVRRMYEKSGHPDEGYVHTLVGNTSDLRTILPCITYSDWTKPPPRPAVLTHADFDQLRQSGQFIARKMSSDVSRGLLERIDSELLSHGGFEPQ